MDPPNCAPHDGDGIVSQTTLHKILTKNNFEAQEDTKKSWLHDLDDIEGEHLQCSGEFISDCVEEIVALDSIDSYVESVRLEQQNKEAANEKKSIDEVPSPLSDEASIAGQDLPNCSPLVRESGMINDVFSDYDSDDESFQAEIQLWQKSAVGQLNQAQKK